MSDLIKYEMIAQLYGSVLAVSSDDENIVYNAEGVANWCKHDDASAHIENLKEQLIELRSELAEQKSINNDLLYEVDELHRRSAIQ